MSPLGRGALIGAFVGLWAGVGANVVLYLHFTRTFDDLERESPILVATRELAPGTRVTRDALEEVDVRWDFVTVSLVAPAELSKVEGLPLVQPLQRGEPLQWATLAPSSAEAVKQCMGEVAPGVKAATDKVTQQVLGELAPRAVSAAPEPLPELEASQHVVRVVSARVPIKDGEAVDITALTIRDVPDWLTTPSAVPASDIEKLAGTRAVGGFEEGDTLLWTLLERADGEPTLTHCALEIDRRADAERKRAAKSLAEGAKAVRAP